MQINCNLVVYIKTVACYKNVDKANSINNIKPFS